MLNYIKGGGALATLAASLSLYMVSVGPLSVGNVDMINGLFVLRTVNNRVNVVIGTAIDAIESSESVSSASAMATKIPVGESQILVFSKATTDIDIWHCRFAHLSYRNVFTNASKVKGMKRVKGSISKKICELCMKGRQQVEISRIFMTKPIVFLEKVSIDIERPLFITARGNKIFVFIKDYVTGMLFWYVCKFKFELYIIFVNFVWFELSVRLSILDWPFWIRFLKSQPENVKNIWMLQNFHPDLTEYS